MKILKMIGLALLGGIIASHLNITIQLLWTAIDDKEGFYTIMQFVVWAITGAGSLVFVLWLLSNLFKKPKTDHELANWLKQFEVCSAENNEMGMDLIARLNKFHETFRIGEDGTIYIIGARIAVDTAEGVELTLPAVVENKHTDDLAVDMFAAAMKAKLALKREQGASGWEIAEPEMLEFRLTEQANKESIDPIDVANYAAFLWNRN